MNANQSVNAQRMQEFANECDMIEAVTATRVGLPQIATCIKNNNNVAIDGIWVTALVLVLSAGYYPVGKKVSSNHLALWVDLPLAEVMGQPDPTANLCIQSLLNVDNFKAKTHYLRATQRAQKASRILSSLRNLDKSKGVKWTQ